MLELNKTKKTIKNKVALLFCFLYPILPVYASVMGVNGRNLLCFFVLLLTIVLAPGLSRFCDKRMYAILLIVCLWIFGRFLQTMVTKSIPEAIYFLLLTIAMFYCLVRLVKDTRIFLLCVFAILSGGYLVSVFGIVEEITHINLFGYLNKSFELNYNPLRFGILRIIGFSQHTIVHGVYIMFCMSLCLYMWQFVKNKRKGKFFLISLYILLAVNLILTLSRSIIIIATISQLLILYLMGLRKFFKIIFKIILIGIPVVFLFSLFIPSVWNVIRAGFLMIAALFNDKAALMISGVFGNDNLKGVGNRLDLYRWVFEEMPGYWVFGHGWNAEFAHPFTQTNGLYTWIQIKDSIEVQYLNTLYQYGLFGMITEIMTFVFFLAICLKNRMKRKEWEPRISFNKIAFATFLCYFLELFAVNQSSDRYIFYLFAMMVMLYNSKGLKHGLFIQN